jgi:hypothetical protein
VPAAPRSQGVGFEILDQVGKFIPVRPGNPFQEGIRPEIDTQAIVSHDWSKCGALIVDTCDEMSDQILISKSSQVDKIDDFGGYKHPRRLDYNVAIRTAAMRLKEAFTQKCHVILVSHTDDKNESFRTADGQDSSKVVARGFGTTGSKAITQIEGIFKPALVYVEAMHMGVNHKFTAHFTPKQLYRAKWAGGAPIPGPMDITGETGCQQFWEFLLSRWSGYLRLGLHGNSGDGKTTLATSIAGVLDKPVAYVGYDSGSLDQIGAWPSLLKE